MNRAALILALGAAGAALAPPAALPRAAVTPRADRGRSLQTEITLTPLIDNETVAVNRLRMEAGAGESIHTHSYPLLVILLADADVERTLGSERTRTTERAGSVWFAPANAPHASRNAGDKGVEAIAIAIKPTRARAPATPATQAPPGITRTTVLDNADARAVRARFAPDGREPVHTHPYDLLTVQISKGRMEILEGSSKTTEDREPGFVKFLPRDVPHAFASADANPFEIVAVTIK